MAESVWFNDEYYYVISPGQFGHGWDLYRKGGKIVDMSGSYCTTREQARDEAFAAFQKTAL